MLALLALLLEFKENKEGRVAVTEVCHVAGQHNTIHQTLRERDWLDLQSRLTYNDTIDVSFPLTALYGRRQPNQAPQGGSNLTLYFRVAT